MKSISIITSIIGLFLVVIGTAIQLNGQSLASHLLHMNQQAVAFQDLYSMNLSLIFIGFGSFILGGLILLIEYFIFRFESFKKNI